VNALPRNEEFRFLSNLLKVSDELLLDSIKTLNSKKCSISTVARILLGMDEGETCWGFNV
jgi:hypothetical protein